MGFVSKCMATAIVALAIVFSLSSVTAARAHAPINKLRWDDPVHPTKLIATSGEDNISSKAGTFYLKVYDAQGKQVDKGDTAVTSGTEMTVSVQPNLAVGQYRVDWKTASADDGDSADGSLPISILPAGSLPSQPAPVAAVPSAVSAPHDHDSGMADDHNMDVAQTPATPSGPVTIEVKLSGANEVPPVTSPVTAFARLRFDPAMKALKYDLTVSGVSPNLITAAHIHRGAPGVNGGHAFDLTNSPFMQISGNWNMSDADVQDLLAGNLYINVHSVAIPSGAARGQIVVPMSASSPVVARPATAPTIAPPRTGDAGLLDQGTRSSRLAVVGALALIFSGAGVLSLSRRRQ